VPAIQKQFDEFHSNIKLDEDDEKAKLREKRDTLLKALRANLGEDVPAFDDFHQGSYSMNTGVVPLDGNFDIDVGLIFDCKRDKYPDPVKLKKEVRDALDTNGRTVVIRRPCVTVNYVSGGKTLYHVDLAVYAKRDDNTLELTRLVCEAFSDKNDLAQYRRCIRYMKRWRDVQFASGGAPLSIALTVAAMRWFKPRFEASGRAADLLATLDWVKATLSQFRGTSTAEGWHERLAVTLPVTPYNDLMDGMTKAQMETLKSKLETLRDALDDAYEEELPEEAAKKLRKQFGDDFPVPEKAQTGKAVAAPYISTGTSA
jgi:hypothetical protein